MGSAADWHAFLDEFRAFGGKAENVMQRKGLFGMGLFPIDSSKPIELQVPNRLLVAIDNIELKDGEIIIKDTNTFPDGYADWFRRYQSNYSWGAEGRENTLAIEEGLKSLPDEVQQILKRSGLYNSDNRYPEQDKDQELLRRFIQTRCINFKGKRVIMPMIELLNHGTSANPYDMSGDGIAVGGLFEGEVLVKYSISDPIRRFFGYGFNAQEPFGYSLSFRLQHRDQKIFVRGGGSAGSPTRDLNVQIKGDTMVVEQPLLASTNSPKIPRTLFVKAFQKFNGVDANELFDQIHQRNSRVFIQLIRLLNTVEGDTSENLRTACLDQLLALSHRIGQRDDLLDQAAPTPEAA
uniref:hypothetical protein n=1 Tax=Synechococcus sp. UW106 TaxID=368495 RepID=UPI000E0F5490|nr:hypothetical protein [Synechococcus sp. UW106]